MTAIEIAGKSYEPREIVEQAKKARGWFAAIAAFSFVNSLLIMFGVEVSFVIGLGATQVVDAIVAVTREQGGASVGAVVSVIGLLMNLCIIGMVVFIWWASGRGSTAAYIVGMVLYALDGFIFLAVGDWIGVGFHVFFLFMLWGGFRFMREWRKAEAFLGQAAPGPQPETYVTPMT
jgi:hypothetical protein